MPNHPRCGSLLASAATGSRGRLRHGCRAGTPHGARGGRDGLRRPLLRRHHRAGHASSSARYGTAGTSSPTPRPGCWGPMITPAIKGGHEVTLPVAVEGAEVGDAIAIRIRDITVTSLATSSGHDRIIDGRFNGDPYCAKVCPGCGAADEATVVEGIGEDAVRCASCGAAGGPFAFANGYTIAFDDERSLGVTVGRRRRPRRSPGTPRTTPRCRAARSRTRSCCSPRTTSSASSPGCGRSWASSARPRRSTCRTPTTPATSARSCSGRPTPTP